MRDLRWVVFRFAVIIFLIGGVAAMAALGQTAVTGLPQDCSAYASVPLPIEAEKVVVPKTAPSCASYRSYRGVRRPVNYADARACAWQERLAQEAGLDVNPVEPWAIGGSLILADIYFNGAGIDRNIPLALRLACEREEEMVKLALPDIAKLNGARRIDGPFEFCYYAATTIAMTECSRYGMEIADDRRSRYYNSLKPRMTADQWAAFEKLLEAKKVYVVAHAQEVYQGGTIRGIRTMGSQDILEDLFRVKVVHFERKRWPLLSEQQIAAADALLLREYDKQIKASHAATQDEIDEGAVTTDHLAKVQVAWEAYREAWVAFAKIRYPAEVAAIRAEITLGRYRLLKTIS